MKTALVSLGLVALTVAACSPASIAAPDAGAPAEAGTSSDGGPNASAIAQVCKDYAYARCTRIQTCSPTQILVAYGDVATCESIFTASCEVAQRAPGTSSSLAGEQACIAAIPGWACSDIIYSENFPPACVVSPGPLADGSPCATAGQCMSTWCRRPAGGSCGTCAPAPKAGDPCTLTSDCGSGLTCADQTCGVHAPLGGSCASQSCDDGLMCAGGICQATIATPGAPCSSFMACDQYAGLSCDGATGTCQTLTVASPGQACGTVQNQYQTCKAGTCTRGICVGHAGLGEPCDLGAGPSCLGNSTCVVTSDGGTAGTCQTPGTGCF